MEALNADIIALLKDLFKNMETSRGRLRPILVDIANSIEKGFFIDADSEEVNALLKQILEAQEKFLTVEQTKKAANSKKLEQVNKTLVSLEQNAKREEIIQVLSKIGTMVLDSDEKQMIDAIRKVKLQADHIRNKFAKNEGGGLAKLAERYVFLKEIVESDESITTEKYLEAVKHFPDNPILLMALSQNKLHFPKPVEVSEVEEDVKYEKSEQQLPAAPSARQIAALLVKAKKIKPPLDLSLVISKQDDFEIERAQSKKNFTIKSFNNKLHELLDSSDPAPIFRLLIDTRIFFKDSPEKIKPHGKFSKRLSVFIPHILDKLFNWGIVDKVTWRGIQFYYLNNAGFELCIKSFRAVSRNVATSNESDFDAMTRSLKVALMKIFEPRFKDGLKFQAAYNAPVPFARAEILIDKEERQVVLMFSLILIGEKWVELIAKIRLFIEFELNAGVDVKAIFLFTFGKNDLSWLKLFDMVKFKGITLFMCTPEGLFDKKGTKIPLDDWEDFAGFGTPTHKPIKKALPAAKVDEEKLSFAEDKTFEEDIFLPDENISEETPPIIDDVETIDLPTLEETVTAETFEEPVEENTVEVVEEKISEPPKKVEPAVDDAEKNLVNDLAKVDGVTGVTNLFKVGAVGRAMLALHALKDFVAQNEPDNENWATYLADEIGFILNDPLTLEHIQGVDTFAFWTNVVEIPKANVGKTFDYLNLAAMIKNFFAPAEPTSYQLQKSWRQLNEDKSNSALKNFPAAKNLISLFNNFTEKTHRAFADCLVGAGNTSEDNFQRAVAQIKTVENVVESVLHSDVNHRRVKDVINQLFTNNGYIRKYLNVEEYNFNELLNFCRQFEAVDLNGIVYDANAKIDEELFSEEKIDELLDHTWNNPQVQLTRKGRENFKGPKRKKVTGVVFQCLTTILNYIHAKKNLDNSANSGNQAAPVEKALEVLTDLKSQISKFDKKANLGQVVFKLFVENLERKLNGENVLLTYRDCILTARYIELDNGMPTINSFGVDEFSLKNRVTSFETEMKGKTFGTVLTNAYESALRNYDCGILIHIAKYFLPQLGVPDEEIRRKLIGLEKQVDRQIDRVYNEFLSDLELARNYSRITDQEKIEFYINAAVDARKHFMQTKNAGLFQRFIDACNDSINKTSLPQKNALTKRLKKLEDSLEKNLEGDETIETRYPILANVRRQIDLMNLTVAEDYMNRLENEGGTLLTDLDVTGSDISTLEDFLNEYEALYRAVVGASASLENVYRQRLHIGRANRETQNALDFLHGWQGLHSGQNSAIESAVIEILNHVGYEGGKISAVNVDALNQKSYTVTFDEPIRARENYPHPFAVFGTEIYTKGLEIIFLGANRKWENIAQVLGGMTVDRGTICVTDIALTLPERRSIARVMKLTANLKNIIVLDKVAALYLARFDDANRGKRMLQTLLPFARVQPYMTGGVIAPEMFIGRSEELDQIRDMRGPVFVYGGRQLGKSALLRQVRNIEHNPRQLNYAFFIDLKNLNSEQTLKKIVYELSNAKLIGEVQDWDEFSLKIHKLMDGQLRGIEKPKKLLLLMDESDTFLSEKTSEAAINVLRELLVTFNGRFKFVLAGLHKVIRFEQNSSFGNLNHISVLPFRPSDAMELLIKPMSYLGFRISDDSLISAIFSRTNYYPGSIQYYCKMLVDAVGSNYTKQNFDVTKNPPYTLDDDYLKNMLGNREFQEEIRQKFQITLCLDDDNYYEILALAVAMAYYENGRPIGVSVGDIKDYCLMCGVEKISKLSDAEVLSLLDEMVTLNILRRTEDGNFEFNRYAFWHMMGTVEEVNNKLDSYGLLGGKE